MSKICLSMIVRNESHCIARCLNSVKWLVDCYKLVDTGSTDNTIAVIQETMQGIPGEVIISPWQDSFCLHRNEALPKIGEFGLEPNDYTFMMDADDEMVVLVPFSKEALVDGCYSIANVDGEMSNYRPHLWKLGYHAGWIFARHEILAGLPDRSLLKREQVQIKIHHEGDRSRNPYKGLDDAIAIMSDMKNYPKDSIEYRYCMFLLGCCFLDIQIFDKAMGYFKAFLKLSTGEDALENIWMANNLIANCAYMMHHPMNEVVEAYMSAINADPERLETYMLLARLLIDQDSLQSAKMIMGVACKLKRKSYVLKHMEGWWDLREKFYQEICDTIREETP